jgi:hypothetical protein
MALGQHWEACTGLTGEVHYELEIHSVLHWATTGYITGRCTGHHWDWGSAAQERCWVHYSATSSVHLGNELGDCCSGTRSLSRWEMHSDENRSYWDCTRGCTYTGGDELGTSLGACSPSTVATGWGGAGKAAGEPLGVVDGTALGEPLGGVSITGQ